MCERFTYGLFRNSGYKEVYSDGAKKLLTKQSLEQLKSLGLKKGQLSDVVTMHFSSEGVVTRSYLQLANDVYGRSGVVNHTILIRTADFINEFPEALNALFDLIEAQTSLDFSKSPKTLEPLEVKR